MESICDACQEEQESVTIEARVLRADCCELLVCCLSTSQRYLVRSSQARCFRPGQCVAITYSGASTRSIPPQLIGVTHIERYRGA